MIIYQATLFLGVLIWPYCALLYWMFMLVLFVLKALHLKRHYIVENATKVAIENYVFAFFIITVLLVIGGYGAFLTVKLSHLDSDGNDACGPYPSGTYALESILTIISNTPMYNDNQLENDIYVY